MTIGICSGCTVVGNRTATSPGWLAAQPSDWTEFRLAAGSAAVDTGLNLGGPNANGLDPADVVWPPSIEDQNLHGSTWEMGAFVYTTSIRPRRTLCEHLFPRDGSRGCHPFRRR